VKDLSTKFKKRWEEKPGGLKGVFRPTEPLKPQVNKALNRVEIQNQRINNYIERYSKQNKELFEKIVQAQESHDNERVKMLANELAELRKQRNILVNSRLSLDNVVLRLRTLFEFGNTVSSISPILGILKTVRSGVAGVMPEVGKELFVVQNTLGEIISSSGLSEGDVFSFNTKSVDAENIMKEAAMIVENRIKTKLPDDFSKASQLVIDKDSNTK
jgi:division protein CdvB (Snf7/Vps24/ESCRT-III family)